MTLQNPQENMNRSSFVHRGQTVVPNHLKFRLKAIQRRLQSSRDALQEIRNTTNNTQYCDYNRIESLPWQPPVDIVKDESAVSTKEQKQTKKVHFAPMAKVMLVPRLAGDEMKNVWYNSWDYRKFDHDRRRSVAVIKDAINFNTPIDESKYTMLGLERYINFPSSSSMYQHRSERNNRRGYTSASDNSRNTRRQESDDRYTSQSPTSMYTNQRSVPVPMQDNIVYPYDPKTNGYPNYVLGSPYSPYNNTYHNNYPSSPQQMTPPPHVYYMNYAPSQPHFMSYDRYSYDSPAIITPLA